MKKYFLCGFFMILLFSFKKKERTWVAIGDSITYLNDHLDETGKRMTKGYLTLVTHKFKNLRYINQGHNGWTTGRMADAIDKIGLVPADIYTIFLGTNDWWGSNRLGTFRDYQENTGSKTTYGAYRILINRCRELNAAAKIILITPLQRGDFVYVNNYKNNAFGSYREKNGQSLEQFVNAIDSIGRYEHFKVIDLYHNSGIDQNNMVRYKRLKDSSGVYKNFSYPSFIGVPFNPATDEYPYPPGAMNMTFDGLHPSDKGHAVIARKLEKVMRKYR